MASISIQEAQTTLVKAFLEYTDWNGSSYAPYAVTLGTKREADPRRLAGADGTFPTIEFPAIAVQQYQAQVLRELGNQDEIGFGMRVSVIYQYAEGEEPTTKLREVTGKIIDNILGSKDEEDIWVGLTWVSDIKFPSLQPPNNMLEEFLRGIPLADGTGGGYTGSVTDFTCITFAVPTGS